jgi:hypothetical protein
MYSTLSPWSSKSRLVPDATNDMPISTMVVNNSVLQVTSTYVRTQLCLTCQRFGRKAVFGFAANKIGNKSIRSGAAMSLFLTNTHTPDHDPRALGL